MDLVLTKVKEGEASNGPWFSGLWTWVASGSIYGSGTSSRMDSRRRAQAPGAP